MSGAIPLKWRAAGLLGGCWGLHVFDFGGWSGHLPDHSRITHSRNRTALEGHGRTPIRWHSSSGGPLRSRQDSRGPVGDKVRDREAEGSSPSPPTKICTQIPPSGGANPIDQS